MTNRLLKKPHMLRCAQSTRINVLNSTPLLVDFSRVSPLRLFEQPVIRVIQQSASVVSLKFVEEVQTMQRLKSNSNPPVSPFFKGGFFSVDSYPPLFGKRGKGKFSEECRGSYAANFWYRILEI